MKAVPAVPEIAISSILRSKDLYPRVEVKPERVTRYKRDLEGWVKDNPVEVNQDNYLIDGAHRIEAATVLGWTKIPYKVTETESLDEVLDLAVARNRSHGGQMSQKSKLMVARWRWDKADIRLENLKADVQKTVGELAEYLSVTERTVRRWFKPSVQVLADERNRLVLEDRKAKVSVQEIREKWSLSKELYEKIISDRLAAEKAEMQERNQRLRQARAEGASIKQLSEASGLSESQVRRLTRDVAFGQMPKPVPDAHDDIAPQPVEAQQEDTPAQQVEVAPQPVEAQQEDTPAQQVEVPRKAPANGSLAKARAAKNDEFFTGYSDIAAELQDRHYPRMFEGKTVYCPCDNPDTSQFVRYFKGSFEELGIHQLIATSFGETGQLLRYDGKGQRVTQLKGDGDFRSEECEALFLEADVVVTNPPFSLWGEFFALLNEHELDYVLLGPLHAATNPAVFGKIQSGEVILGSGQQDGRMTFDTPDGDSVQHGNMAWYTNLSPTRVGEELPEASSRQYDNYPDAIDISRLEDIPSDYPKPLGVPITYLQKHDPERFEIVGSDRSLAGGRFVLNGQKLFARVVIRRKFPERQPQHKTEYLAHPKMVWEDLRWWAESNPVLQERKHINEELGVSMAYAMAMVLLWAMDNVTDEEFMSIIKPTGYEEPKNGDLKP